MFVLNGISQPISTKRSYLLRSIFPAVYLRPPLATIRRSRLMSSSCTIVTFLESHRPGGHSVEPTRPWRDQPETRRGVPERGWTFSVPFEENAYPDQWSPAPWSHGLRSCVPVLLRSMTANDVNRGRGNSKPRASLPESAVGLGKRWARLLVFVFQSWTPGHVRFHR